ncbi:MAG: ABC transporter permease [Deltaproteobacteria bacterium]|nr:ABC transporter permease [Deltaproteobacteria bacterium]
MPSEPAGHKQSSRDERELKVASVAGRSLSKEVLARMLQNRMAVFSGVVLLILGFLTIFGLPLLDTFSGIVPLDTQLEMGATSPSSAHWMGTDLLGRDMFARILQGGRLSLLIGIIATLVSLSIGVFYGALAGFVGGRVDNFMMRVVDVLYALPYMFVIIILMVMVRGLRSSIEPGSLLDTLAHPSLALFFALGAVQWLTMARIVRGQVLSLKRLDFVVAARTMGVSDFDILWRHLVPNTIGPVVVFATLTIPSVILQEAFISFLGLGVEAPDASWGTLISDGRKAMTVFPWLLAFPAVFLALTIFALNSLGDGLRDALDPQSGD